MTGGLGFIGSNLALALARADAEVTVVDACYPRHGANPRNLDAPGGERVRRVTADLADPAARDAVDGIDVVFIAPNDLAQSMGHQGEPGHPEVQAAIADGLRSIAACGRAPGTLCAPDRVEHFVGLGARFLYTSFDNWIAAGATAFLAAVDGASPRS